MPYWKISALTWNEPAASAESSKQFYAKAPDDLLRQFCEHFGKLAEVSKL